MATLKIDRLHVHTAVRAALTAVTGGIGERGPKCLAFFGTVANIPLAGKANGPVRYLGTLFRVAGAHKAGFYGVGPTATTIDSIRVNPYEACKLAALAAMCQGDPARNGVTSAVGYASPLAGEDPGEVSASLWRSLTSRVHTELVQVGVEGYEKTTFVAVTFGLPKEDASEVIRTGRDILVLLLDMTRRLATSRGG